MKEIFVIARLGVEIEHPFSQPLREALPNLAPFYRADSSHIVQRISISFGETKVPESFTQKHETLSEGLLAKQYVRDQDKHTLITFSLEGEISSLEANEAWDQVSFILPEDGVYKFILLDRMLMACYVLRAMYFNIVKIHSSTVMLHGRALAFLGVSGTGKSTHSRLWLKHVPEVELLNDDEPLIELVEDGSVYIYGSPWSGSTPCYRDERAILAGLIQLQQYPENILSRLDGANAFNSIFYSISLLTSSERHNMAAFDLSFKISEKVPLYLLRCRPDEEALSLSRPLIDKL